MEPIKGGVPADAAEFKAPEPVKPSTTEVPVAADTSAEGVDEEIVEQEINADSENDPKLNPDGTLTIKGGTIDPLTQDVHQKGKARLPIHL